MAFGIKAVVCAELIGLFMSSAMAADALEAPLPVARPASTATVPALAPPAAQPAGRAAIRAIVEQEAKKIGLPPDIAEAVVRVESGYDPTVIGSVGEIGLMQVRPATAAMLGFKGDSDELAKPEVNIHYGVTYLGQAWQLANGDLCRALMKYRAGHGQEVMTPLSQTYCSRARGHLASLGSPFATAGTTDVVVPAFVSTGRIRATKARRGTPGGSRAFWAAEESRVRAITARLHAKWGRLASR